MFRSVSDKITLRTRREKNSATHTSLAYNFVVFWVRPVRHDRYVQLLALPVSRHGAHDMANDLSCWHISLCRMLLIESMAMSQNEAALRNYIETILRTE